MHMSIIEYIFQIIIQLLLHAKCLLSAVRMICRIHALAVMYYVIVGIMVT